MAWGHGQSGVGSGEEPLVFRMVTFPLVLAFVLLPVLPLLGTEEGKDKEDPLITAMKFVKAPRGAFWMGWNSVDKQSKQVEIKQDFELAAYTVTQEQWQALMGNNPSAFSRQGIAKEAVHDIADADLKRFPVEWVSWEDCQQFLKKLNAQQQGKGWSYRLPTSAEWEYACRNAATSQEECSFDFYFDRPSNDLSSKQANFHGNLPAGKAEKGPDVDRPTKVGSYAPNKLGLHDRHGNVLQWCDDLFGEGPERVLRGGCWDFLGKACCAGYDRVDKPSARRDTVGFRVARVRSGTK